MTRFLVRLIVMAPLALVLTLLLQYVVYRVKLWRHTRKHGNPGNGKKLSITDSLCDLNDYYDE